MSEFPGPAQIKTGDPTIKQRILDYNEDDCRATRVLLDGVRTLE
jgi:predicted RecB family nuclease